LAEGAFGLAFCSVSAGIFDHEEHLVAAMTIPGMSGRSDLSAESSAAQLLWNAADKLSAALGSIKGRLGTRDETGLPIAAGAR